MLIPVCCAWYSHRTQAEYLTASASHAKTAKKNFKSDGKQIVKKRLSGQRIGSQRNKYLYCLQRQLCHFRGLRTVNQLKEIKQLSVKQLAAVTVFSPETTYSPNPLDLIKVLEIQLF